MPINVVWFGVDHRLTKNCVVMLNEMFDTYDCTHYIDSIPAGIEGAVVVVHGEACHDKVARLNVALSELKWAIVILLGDETHMLSPSSIHHPRMRLWLQEPVPGLHKADRYILDGWTHGCKQVDIPKDLAIFFGGQDTHQRRKECINALRDQFDWDVVMVLSKGYTLGVSRDEYFRMMSRAKFVPCPCGPSSPDSARPWEALQCGAIPILDSRGGYEGRFPVTGDFWSLVLGNHPLPVVSDWAQFPHYFKAVLMPDYSNLLTKCLDWWQAYKVESFGWLAEDLSCLK